MLRPIFDTRDHFRRCDDRFTDSVPDFVLSHQFIPRIDCVLDGVLLRPRQAQNTRGHIVHRRRTDNIGSGDISVLYIIRHLLPVDNPSFKHSLIPARRTILAVRSDIDPVPAAIDEIQCGGVHHHCDWNMRIFTVSALVLVRAGRTRQLHRKLPHEIRTKNRLARLLVGTIIRGHSLLCVLE